MSVYALLLPMDGEPEVVSDPHWLTAAVAAQLGRDDSYYRHRLHWSPTPERGLALHGNLARPGQPVNPSALALAGALGAHFHGAVLVTAHAPTGDAAASLTKFDLLVIGTRLLIGEVTQRAIEAE